MLEEDIQERLVDAVVDEFFSQTNSKYYFDSIDFMFQLSPLVHVYKSYLQFCLELAVKDQTHEIRNIFHSFFQDYEPGMVDYMYLRKMYEDDLGGSQIGNPRAPYDTDYYTDNNYDTDLSD